MHDKNTSSDTTSAHWSCRLRAQWPVAAGVVGAALFIFVFRHGFWAVWSQGESWHLLIPLIAAFTFINRARSAAPIRPRPAYWMGGCCIIVATLGVLAGMWSGTGVFSELSLVLGIFGVFLTLFGLPFFLVFSPSLAYLLFVTSATDGVFNIFAPLFRLVSAKIAFAFASLGGMALLREATYIRLPHMTLNVADECSGVNHVISLLAISIPLAQLTCSRFRKQFIIVAASVPIALLANGIRVFIIILYNYSRTEFDHGPRNLLVTDSGFFIGLVVLFAFARALEKIWPEERVRQSRSLWEFPAFRHAYAGANIVVVTALLAAGALYSIVFAPQAHPRGGNLAAITMAHGQWSGRDATDLPLIANTSAPHARLSRIYTDSDANTVSLYLGFYDVQSDEQEVVGYANDWLRRDGFDDTVGITPDTTVMIRFSLQSDSLSRYAVALWYFTDCRHMTAPLATKMQTIVDAFTRRSTAGTLVVCVTPVRSRGAASIRALPEFDTLRRFIADMYPEIRKAVTR